MFLDEFVLDVLDYSDPSVLNRNLEQIQSKKNINLSSFKLVNCFSWKNMELNL